MNASTPTHNAAAIRRTLRAIRTLRPLHATEESALQWQEFRLSRQDAAELLGVSPRDLQPCDCEGGNE
jgi:hypothetical protein